MSSIERIFQLILAVQRNTFLALPTLGLIRLLAFFLDAFSKGKLLGRIEKIKLEDSSNKEFVKFLEDTEDILD